MIHDEFSQLTSLISWAFSQQDQKIKIIATINGSVTVNNMKVTLTLWTINYVDCALSSCKKNHANCAK